MEDTKNLKDEFYQRISGEWETEFEKDGKKEKIRIIITNFFWRGRLIWVIDGKETQNKEFVVPHDWVGNWMVADSYFIEYSNQDVLIFGESNSAVIGGYDWRHVFHRANT